MYGWGHEITRKNHKIISIGEYPYQTIEFALSEYRVLKEHIIQTNISAKVLFLDCPYYSITRANKIIGWVIEIPITHLEEVSIIPLFW